MLIDAFRYAGLVPKLSMLMGVVPLALAAVYAIWPTEQRLTLMRPLSLATIFAALSGTVLGTLNVLLYMSRTDPPTFSHVAVLGLSEALFPTFLGFGLLTAAWLLIALGMWRRP
jgi:hypothetical protein